jgi:FMN phosphatase YigB (HAD superfamily)
VVHGACCISNCIGGHRKGQEGSASDWLDAAHIRSPTPLSFHERAALESLLNLIWEGARIGDPESTRDLSFAAHERVFHELLAAGPGIDPSLSAALYEVMLDMWHTYEDTIPTLEALQEIGVTVCLLSNAGVPIRTVLDHLPCKRGAYGRRQRSR